MLGSSKSFVGQGYQVEVREEWCLGIGSLEGEESFDTKNLHKSKSICTRKMRESQRLKISWHDMNLAFV